MSDYARQIENDHLGREKPRIEGGGEPSQSNRRICRRSSCPANQLLNREQQTDQRITISTQTDEPIEEPPPRQTNRIPCEKCAKSPDSPCAKRLQRQEEPPPVAAQRKLTPPLVSRQPSCCDCEPLSANSSDIQTVCGCCPRNKRETPRRQTQNFNKSPQRPTNVSKAYQAKTATSYSRVPCRKCALDVDSPCAKRLQDVEQPKLEPPVVVAEPPKPQPPPVTRDPSCCDCEPLRKYSREDRPICGCFSTKKQEPKRNQYNKSPPHQSSSGYRYNQTRPTTTGNNQVPCRQCATNADSPCAKHFQSQPFKEEPPKEQPCKCQAQRQAQPQVAKPAPPPVRTDVSQCECGRTPSSSFEDRAMCGCFKRRPNYNQQRQPTPAKLKVNNKYTAPPPSKFSPKSKNSKTEPEKPCPCIEVVRAFVGPEYSTWTTSTRIEFLEYQMEELRSDLSCIKKELKTPNKCDPRTVELEQRLNRISTALATAREKDLIEQNSSLLTCRQERMQKVQYYKRPSPMNSRKGSACGCQQQPTKKAPRETTIATIIVEHKDRNKLGPLGSMGHVLDVSSSSLVLRCGASQTKVASECRAYETNVCNCESDKKKPKTVETKKPLKEQKSEKIVDPLRNPCNCSVPKEQPKQKVEVTPKQKVKEVTPIPPPRKNRHEGVQTSSHLNCNKKNAKPTTGEKEVQTLSFHCVETTRMMKPENRPRAPIPDPPPRSTKEEGKSGNCPPTKSVQKTDPLPTDPKVLKPCSSCKMCCDLESVVLITCNLWDEVIRKIGEHKPGNVALTIGMESPDLYHINVALMKTSESLCCLYCTEGALNQAMHEHMFEDFLTFFLMDSRNDEQDKLKFFNFSFELMK